MNRRMSTVRRSSERRSDRSRREGSNAQRNGENKVQMVGGTGDLHEPGPTSAVRRDGDMHEHGDSNTRKLEH